GESGEPVGVGTQPALQPLRHAVLAPVRQVELVRGEDAIGGGSDRLGDGLESGVLLRGGGLRERDGCRARGDELVVEAELLRRSGRSGHAPSLARPVSRRVALRAVPPNQPTARWLKSAAAPRVSE